MLKMDYRSPQAIELRKQATEKYMSDGYTLDAFMTGMTSIKNDMRALVVSERRNASTTSVLTKKHDSNNIAAAAEKQAMAIDVVQQQVIKLARRCDNPLAKMFEGNVFVDHVNRMTPDGLDRIIDRVENTTSDWMIARDMLVRLDRNLTELQSRSLDLQNNVERRMPVPETHTITRRTGISL